MSIEAAAEKADEQWEFAGTSQLGFDSYVRNIIAAWAGDRVLYAWEPFLIEKARQWSTSGEYVQVYPEVSDE